MTVPDSPVKVPGWEHFPHEADVGLRGWGRSLTEAFQQAALALTAVVTRIESIHPNKKITLECNAPDHEVLFLDWLNKIIYFMATENMLFNKFKLNIIKNKLTAELWGEPVERSRHQPAVEVKGATFTCLKVKQLQPDQWYAQCVVDV
jgi:tRNA nucleotidyltransferase (CCA-adding enzyme)